MDKQYEEKFHPTNSWTCMPGKAFQDFCHSSAIRGVAPAAKATNVCVRLCWIEALLFGAGLAVHMLYSLIQFYIQYPVTTTVKAVIKETGFPDVTVCNLQPFRSQVHVSK